MIAPQRRTSWTLLSIVYITAVWSWTSQRIIFVPLAQRASTTFANFKEKDVNYRGQTGRGRQEIFKKPYTVSAGRINLLYSYQEDQEISTFAKNDSKLVNSLIRARTTKEVEITLKEALASIHAKGMGVSEVNLDGSNQTVVETLGIPFSSLSLNATAAALRRMAHISVIEARSEAAIDHNYWSDKNRTLTATSGDRLKSQKKMIANLIEATEIKLMSHRSMLTPSESHQTSSLQEHPGVYPLSDVLQALAVLAADDATKEKMKPFANLVVKFLNTYETPALYRLGPIRLVQCLQAMGKLGIDHTSLHDKIFQRLLKPDAVSKIPARFLAHGLSSMATLQTVEMNRPATQYSSDWKLSQQSDIKDNKHNEETPTDMIRLSRAFMRRLRKEKVVKEASAEDMCRALVATRKLLDLGAMTTMEDEAAIFGFTALRTILEIKKTNEKNHNTTSPTTSLLLTPTQLTDMISSWASLSDQRREDTVIGEILQISMDDKILARCNIRQLEHITRSIRILKVANHAEVTKCIGERLLALVEESETSNIQNISPKSTNEILRSSVLVHRRNTTVMEPFSKCASLLFNRKSFLEQSSVKEIANYLWILSIARRYDEEILVNIGDCLLKDEMVDNCSSKIASQILATFTSLLVLGGNLSSESLMELKEKLFYSYGGHLLSSKLSPAEISSALYAYAKANYVQDRGVFDHLVNLLASLRQECSSRQLSQTIWSCGKMIAWERQETDLLDNEDLEMKDPPYLENAKKIAMELSSRAEELSPEDVAQIFWGIGRLEIQNDEILSVFANRAIEISSSMNSVEVSNVLWGVSKVQFRDGKLIGSLSSRLASDAINISSPRVASSILFSLGRLRWKDEIVFRKLSNAMVDQIEDVNARSVANTLWSFRAVRMRPPQELLDTWAITRLGLVPAILKQTAD